MKKRRFAKIISQQIEKGNDTKLVKQIKENMVDKYIKIKSELLFISA